MANSRDRQILNSIVNPLLPIGEGVHDLEQECFASNLEDEISDREETRISKQYEKVNHIIISISNLKWVFPI